MRTLILTPHLPYPPHQGAALRNYGIIHGLHNAGHEVTLLSFHDNGLSPHKTPLAALCETLKTALPPRRSIFARLRDLIFSRQPDLARRLYSPDFAALVKTTLHERQFDLVQFEGLEMTAYLPLVRQLQASACLCYDAHNAEYHLQRIIAQTEGRSLSHLPGAIYSQIQTRYLRRFERAVGSQVDSIIAVSEEDAAALRSLGCTGPVNILTNGIFVADYAESPEELALGPNALVFTGKMDYRPNVDAMLWFGESVLPRIQEAIPDVRLYIVGQKPHRRLDSLRAKANIEITGWVAQVLPFLHAAGVYIAPLRMGSGTRLKILEAMAAGCPIVATSAAASGLRAEARDAILVKDGEAALADAIITLLQEPQRRQELGSAAREVARQHYDWSALIPGLLAAYKDMGLG